MASSTPVYRIPLSRGFVASHAVVAAQFKFPLSVWVAGATGPVKLPAALDTFADYSALPVQAFAAQGGLIPPTFTPPPGRHSVDDELDFAFPSAPPPINQFKFRSRPCRIDPRPKKTERFHLALRDLVDSFTLRFEYDAVGQLVLALELKSQHRGRPIQ